MNVPNAGRYERSVKVINLPSREKVKLNETENAWKLTPKSDVDDVEVLCKRIRSILNKLCPQKFDTLVAQFNEFVIDTEEKLTKVMHLVFEKAINEPWFSVDYARMCKHLSVRNILTENGSPTNFRILLISRLNISI
mgnify:CR=1 FL=1